MVASKVPFYKHDLGAAELAAVEKVLQGPILTTGEAVAEFERKFAKVLNAKHAIGVTSCTGALHLSLIALGVGPGDEVITTPMTFIATATSILEAGATPVFCDIEPDTGNIDANKIEALITEKTKAIMPVHLYGQMCDMRALRKIADKHKLFIVEDAAHCVEGVRDGVQPGELSEFACYSFYATKNLTCGEGGAITTNDDKMAELLKLLRCHGMNKTANDRQKEGYQHWDMVVLGWKYNMDNIQAALLLPQFDRLESNWDKRKALVEYYEKRLSGLPNLSMPSIKKNVKHAYHLVVVKIANGLRDHVINSLQARGITVMVNYRPVHLTQYFSETFSFKKGDFPLAEAFGEEVISLPFFPQMSFDQVDIVADTLAEIMQETAKTPAAVGIKQGTGQPGK